MNVLRHSAWSIEQKHELIAKVLSREISIADAAQEANVTTSTILDWKRRYELEMLDTEPTVSQVGRKSKIPMEEKLQILHSGASSKEICATYGIDVRTANRWLDSARNYDPNARKRLAFMSHCPCRLESQCWAALRGDRAENVLCEVSEVEHKPTENEMRQNDEGIPRGHFVDGSRNRYGRTLNP